MKITLVVEKNLPFLDETTIPVAFIPPNSGRKKKKRTTPVPPRDCIHQPYTFCTSSPGANCANCERSAGMF